MQDCVLFLFSCLTFDFCLPLLHFKTWAGSSLLSWNAIWCQCAACMVTSFREERHLCKDLTHSLMLALENPKKLHVLSSLHFTCITRKPYNNVITSKHTVSKAFFCKEWYDREESEKPYTKILDFQVQNSNVRISPLLLYFVTIIFLIASLLQLYDVVAKWLVWKMMEMRTGITWILFKSSFSDNKFIIRVVLLTTSTYIYWLCSW